MEYNDDHMNKDFSSEEAANILSDAREEAEKIWSEARTRIIEERSRDANFMKIDRIGKLKILTKELQDILPETIKKTQDFSYWAYSYALQLALYIRNVCPKCSHINKGSANYCVKCGELLSDRSRKAVIDLHKLKEYQNRSSEIKRKTDNFLFIIQILGFPFILLSVFFVSNKFGLNFWICSLGGLIAGLLWWAVINNINSILQES